MSDAGGLMEGLLHAAQLFGGRLPELWSGEGAAGVPYPAACRPQAWPACRGVTVAAIVGRRLPEPGTTRTDIKS
ncbi:MAG TPA: hypothetical protein VF635_15315 [Propionibacteriaceae bacterium]